MDMLGAVGSTGCPNAGFKEDIFLVYALDAPSYPSFRGVYGRRRRTEPFEGTLAVVSGGYFRSSPRANAGCEVYLGGCVHFEHNTSGRYIEHVMRELADPDARVVMLYPAWAPEVRQWLNAVRDVGFQVTVTEHCSEAYGLCRGRGWMLSTLRWMQAVTGMEPFFLLATSGVEGEFEQIVAHASSPGEDPSVVAAHFVRSIDEGSRRLTEVLGDYHLFLQLTDPHMRSLQMHISDTDASALRGALVRVAQRQGVVLYDAGDLSKADRSNAYFSDYRHWEEWQSLPSGWARVA